MAILGVIATFTIPKVLSAQQDAKSNAIAKEAIASIVHAYQLYGLENSPDASTKLKDTITPYLNYVRVDTSTVGAFDYPYGTQGDCDANNPCYYFANGAVIQLYNISFGATTPLNGVWFLIDPDGSRINSPQGGGLEAMLYFNGRVATWGTLFSGTDTGWGPYSANTANDPVWFSWN